MLFYITLIFVTYCIFMSLRALFIPNTMEGKQLSIENFLFLALTYITILLGFSIIYLLLELNGLEVFNERAWSNDGNFFNRLETSFYFSAVTLFSVGYGDIYPLGIGRYIAVMEALIGYTIPAAFVARVLDIEKKK
ncbi:two pore domain potassium channel family protein [Bacillaceae bacterium Marseille-Q3522]|nr:two pore domain potassium channel family protein [Bacillaceae bacterium Marseille-Q3522]